MSRLPQLQATGDSSALPSRSALASDVLRREKHFITQGTPRAREITVVLIDDEPLIREALAGTLRRSGFSVVGEARTGEQALELVLEQRPDVVLMDVRLPGISGIQTIERICLHAPGSRVLVLTRSERNKVVEAILAGASGYILKTAPTESILRAIRETAAGECVLSPQVAGKILQRIRELHIPISNSSQTAAKEIRAALTARELQIFTSLATGHSNHQIGDQLGLSANTVSNHVKSILTKLHLHNRIEAAAYAVRAGMS
jgi:DNA-binding NarL/FixJ family response regulator